MPSIMVGEHVGGNVELANRSFTILSNEGIVTCYGWCGLKEQQGESNGQGSAGRDLAFVVRLQERNYLVHPGDQPTLSDILGDTSLSGDVHIKVRLLDGMDRVVDLEFSGSLERTPMRYNPDSEGKTDIKADLCKNYTTLLESDGEAMVGSWTYILETKEFQWSEGMYKLFGVKPATIVHPRIYVDVASIEDRNMGQLISSYIRTGSRKFEEQIRINVDGKIRTLKVKGAPVQQEGMKKVIGVDIDITALTESSLDLQEQHQLLAESQTIGKLGSFEFDVATNDVLWSDEMYRLMGVAAGTELSFESAISYFHPEDALRLANMAAKAIATGEGFETEALFRRVGEMDYRHMCIINKVIKDRFGITVKLRGIGQDITDRKNASQEILRMQEMLANQAVDKYHQLFASIDEGFAIIEVMFDGAGEPIDYKFHEANPAFERQTGFSNAVGKTMRSLVPGHEQHWFSMYGRVAQTQAAVRFVEQASQMGRWYDVYAFPTDKPGSNRVAILFHDITERKLAEQELQRLYAELKELDNAKTKFFNNISHEFRTPITLMLGPLEEVIRKYSMDLSEKGVDQLTLVQRNALRLEKLVNTLLDFSRIEAGRMDAAFQPTDIRKMTIEIAANFRGLIENGGLSFHVQADEIDQSIMINRGMYEKILLNLLSNAFKFTLEGSISVLLKDRSETVEIHVVDTGIGIAPTDQKRIFQRFSRVDVSKARTFEGTGIGLAFVKELVSIHNGQLRLKSQTGKGSEFVVVLQKGRAHLPASKIFDGRLAMGQTSVPAHLEEVRSWRHESEPAARRETATKPHTILIADDNADMRAYLSGILESRYNVLKTENGQRALTLMKQEVPTLVIADVMMPEMDGYEMVNVMRGAQSLRRIPVILLTARTTDEESAEGLYQGADDYLIKPFSSRELLSRVDARIQLAAARADAEKNLVKANSDLEHRIQQYTAELRMYNTQLKNRNTKLQTLNDELSGLTFAASHDLREPLRKMRFFTQRILKEELGNITEVGQQYFQRVLSFVQTMSDMISDISLYSYYEKNMGETTSINLELMLASLRQFLQPVLEEKSATFDFNVSSGLRGDHDQVKQVVHSLISNSLKFCKRDTPLTVSVVGKLISGELVEDRRAQKNQTYYELQVHDNGIGFDQQHQSQIFQIFRKLHRNPNYTGTGIGLTIVRKIMDNHHGFVTVRSSLGHGASFCCYFPTEQYWNSRYPLPPAIDPVK